MTPDQYRRVSELFAEICELPAIDQQAKIEELCGDDGAVREALVALVRNDTRGDSFLEDIGAQARSALAETSSRDPQSLPAAIGRYRVVEKLGAGGMGVVYLAEQDNPRRRVAVKVIRTGAINPGLRRRFDREAQVLGQLKHPGIAHIYDAGNATVDGEELAYFAMEYVDGVPLTDYASKRGLASRQRLELMAQICDGVQHAHDKGVIHRDLKPANILVDSSGRPRILDFGVARATGADVHTMTVQTDAGQLIGTLQYMSPEQVAGASSELDTRSDVYALGVVAFELLTGQPPYDVRNRTIAQIARTIQEEEPTRVSAVDSRFRGDVETILAKSLEKDRARRYGSAAEMASDIRRHLANKPIVARPATTLYQLSKFARRNRALVAGVAVAFIALTAGFVTSTFMYLRADDARKTADAQRQRAESETAKAQAVNDFLVQDMLAAPNPWESGGKDITVAEVLDSASATIDQRFSDQPVIEAAVRATLGDSYRALGLYQQAAPHFARALDIRTQLDERDNRAIAENLAAQAANLRHLGEYEEAEVACREALELNRITFGEPSAPVAETLETFADIKQSKGLYAEAEQTMRNVLAMYAELPDPPDANVARAKNALGSALYYAGKYGESVEVKRDALDRLRRIHGEEHAYIAQILNDLGAAYFEMERFDESEESFRLALPLLINHLGSEHSVVLICQRSLANTISFLGRDDAAIPLLEKTIDISERTIGQAHPETMQAVNSLATLHLRARQPGNAAPLLRTLLERSESQLGKDHAETLKYASNLAWCERHLGNNDVAESLFRRAVAGFDAALGREHPDTMACMDGLAQFLDGQERWHEAAEWFQRVLNARESAGAPEDLNTARFLNMLGECLIKAGEHASAVGPLERCAAICQEKLGADDWRTKDTEEKLRQCRTHLADNS